MAARVLNFVLYQAGWFTCVWAAARGYPWHGMAAALLLVGVHVLLSREPGHQLALALFAAAVGLLVDTLQGWLGLLSFSSGYVVDGLAPPFILAMWMQFATLLHYSLDWLRRRYVLSAALGAVGGPLAFLAGERMGAAVLHPERWPSLLGLAVVWAVVMPVLLLAAERFSGPTRGEYRLPLGTRQPARAATPALEQKPSSD